MQQTFFKRAGAIAVGVLVALSSQATAQTNSDKTDDHKHKHKHEHAEIDKGPHLINPADIQARALSDWEADWQSVYPLLMDGTLDSVMAHKAEKGDKTAEEYRAYYEVGFKTDVERILIDGSSVTFFREGQPLKGKYVNDGHEILTYKSGNQGVRFVFKKSGGDEVAPDFIQFSDHEIVPTKVNHYHLYWGNDRAQLLTEVTNWPTYFFADMSKKDIVEAMTAH